MATPLIDAGDVRALGELAGEGAAGIATIAAGVHAAVAGRVFAALGPPARSVALAHDAIAHGSYAGARGLTAAVVRGAGAVVAATRPPDATPLRADARGRVALGMLGGVWGDRLAARDSVLAPRFALQVDDRRAATGRLAVFVHGLGENGRSWRRPGYAELLADRHALTPVHATYNSGAPIATNGVAFADGLEQLLAGWPVPVTELTLIGHSMGGLVARSACAHGRDHDWRAHLRATVCLGSPHEGAALARAAAAAERAFAALPETRPFAALLGARSAGIRDLEHGLDLPFAPDVDHWFVSASVSRDPEALTGRLFGDLLVHRRSAWAQRTRTERLRFDAERYRHIGGVTHFGLLGHPAVGELLGEWIGEPRRPGLVSAPVVQRP